MLSNTWPSGTVNAIANLTSEAATRLPISNVVYQSEAASAPSEQDLDQLAHASQARNLEEGVTGLLIYDQGRFLQWLEGPADGVERIWDSISRDRRHKRICLLGQSRTSTRLFGDSPLGLAMRRSRARHRSELELSESLIDTVYRQLAFLPPTRRADIALPARAGIQGGSLLARADRLSLESLCESAVVPALVAHHAARALASPAIDPRSEELARLLVAAEPAAAFALIDSLRADGRSIGRLCAGLFEPTARALYELWASDDCDEFDVAQALLHLQAALRRASRDTSLLLAPLRQRPGQHAVLVAPSPLEPHMLGSVIASEMYWRAGWSVSCEFPASDAALSQLVHDHWFDVLELSLSSTFLREHRLAALARSIRAAHAHSLNPGMIVIVDGRVFHDRPGAFAEVGADASSAHAMDIVATAQAHARSAIAPG